MNGYAFSRQWFDFSFENPDLVSPTHTAMYMWFLELNNRMGWSEKFSSPASQSMSAIGLKSYNTYKKIFNDLVDFGFVIIITESKNQYTSCVIALSKFDKAHSKALDKAIEMPNQNLTTQVQSTVQSNDSVIKLLTNKPVIASSIDVSKATLYSLMVEYWLKDFHQGWTFGGSQGKAMKSMASKIKKVLKDAGRENNDLDILEFFKSICQNLPPYFSEKDIHVLDQKFNEIITEIKKGKNGKQTTKDIGQQYRKS